MPQARRVSNSGRPTYGRYTAPPPRRASRHFKPRFNLPWRIIGVSGVVLLVGWFIWTRFTVSKVNVTTILRQQEVKSEVQTLLGKSFSRGNLISLNTTTLASDLATQDPALGNIHITKHFPNTIQIDAIQKQPALGWATGNQRYLLDRTGAIIGTLPTASKLIVVTDNSNLPVNVGQHVVTSSFVAFCSELLRSMPMTGLSITGLSVKETTFDLYAQTNKNYQLIFDTTRPAADEVADLQTVLRTIGGVTPSQYIDMRIRGKAYYK